MDDSWKSLDALLTLRSFIVTEPEKTGEDIIDHRFVAVSATADREEAVRTIQHHDLEVVPVDSGEVLVGIVTVDDVLDIAEMEATEDFHLYAAVRPLATSYRESGIFSLFRKRAVAMLPTFRGPGSLSSGLRPSTM